MRDGPVSASAAAPDIPTLTGLRALAAFLVLVLHVSTAFPNWTAQHTEFLYRGYLGVDLFFLLSGFIISHVYLRQMGIPRAATIRVFLWHRVIRLFPVHAAILVALIAMVAVSPRTGATLNTPEAWLYADLPWHFAMLHAWGTVDFAGWNGPSWSISAELFAYLLFPLLAAALVRLPRPAALIGAMLVLAATAFTFAICGWEVRTAWLGVPALVRVSGEFACGALLYRALVDRGPNVLPERVADIAGIAGLVGYVVAGELSAPDFLLIALLALVLVGVSAAGPALRSVFAARPTVYLGSISYSLYLVHFTLFNVVRRYVEAMGYAQWSVAAKILVGIAMVGAAVAAAAVLYAIIERPARRAFRDALGTLSPARRPGDALQPKLRVGAKP